MNEAAGYRRKGGQTGRHEGSGTSIRTDTEWDGNPWRGSEQRRSMI